MTKSAQKWPQFGFGALLRPLNELRTQDVDSIQLGEDGGPFGVQWLYKGNSSMLILWQTFEMNQSASSFSLIEIQLAFKEPDGNIEEVSFSSYIGLDG